MNTLSQTHKNYILSDSILTKFKWEKLDDCALFTIAKDGDIPSVHHG